MKQLALIVFLPCVLMTGCDNYLRDQAENITGFDNDFLDLAEYITRLKQLEIPQKVEPIPKMKQPILSPRELGRDPFMPPK